MEENIQKTGNVAIIGTPCHLVAADKIDNFSDCLGDTKLDLKIGLFCMENFSYSYMKKLLEKYDVDMKDVNEFQIYQITQL